MSFLFINLANLCIILLGFFFLLLLFVGVNRRFSGPGPWWTVSVGGSGRDVVKARFTRFGWNFFDKDLSIAVAGLLRSWWSFGESVSFAPVRRVTSTRRSFLSQVLCVRVTVCFSGLGRWRSGLLKVVRHKGGSRRKCVFYTHSLRRLFLRFLFPGVVCLYWVYILVFDSQSIVMVVVF